MEIFCAFEASMNPPQKPRSAAGMTLALLFGGGMALVLAFQVRPARSAGPVRLTFHQRGPGVVFELPAGWEIIYNGHQRWRGGTVVDASGRPQMEVWLFADQKPPADAQEISFPWGTARAVTRATDNQRPFISFPQTVVARTTVWDYYLDGGFLSFRIAADKDQSLGHVIRDCLKSLRFD